MSADDFDSSPFELGTAEVSIGGTWIGSAHSFSCRCMLMPTGGQGRWSCGPEQARELRDEAGLEAHVPLRGVAAVVERIGDRDLALDALTMIPRSHWVAELLGLHPEPPVGS